MLHDDQYDRIKAEIEKEITRILGEDAAYASKYGCVLSMLIHERMRIEEDTK